MLDFVDGCVSMSAARAEFSSALMGEGIETDCLRLRPFRSDDVRSAFEWFGDPLVVWFTPSGPDKDLG